MRNSTEVSSSTNQVGRQTNLHSGPSDLEVNACIDQNFLQREICLHRKISQSVIVIYFYFFLSVYNNWPLYYRGLCLRGTPRRRAEIWGVWLLKLRRRIIILLLRSSLIMHVMSVELVMS